LSGLLAAAAGLVALRQAEFPGVEPVGYWPRWAFVLGLVAFDLALLRLLPARPITARRWAPALGGAAAWGQWSRSDSG
jgi:hypothetical protein